MNYADYIEPEEELNADHRREMDAEHQRQEEPNRFSKPCRTKGAWPDRLKSRAELMADALADVADAYRDTKAVAVIHETLGVITFIAGVALIPFFYALLEDAIH